MALDFVYLRILFFLVAFIKDMHDKNSSSLVNVSNFSKTKGLSGNKALNKIPIQFRTK